MSEICQKCKEFGDDRRILWMACFYEMNELGLPFIKEKLTIIDRNQESHLSETTIHDRSFYTLIVCKECRADWMRSIQVWFNDEKEKKESCGSGIFIRRNGVAIEVTEEEFKKLNPNIEPTRCK